MLPFQITPWCKHLQWSLNQPHITYMSSLLTTSSTLQSPPPGWLDSIAVTSISTTSICSLSSISSKTLCGTSTPPSTRWPIPITLTSENLLRYILHSKFLCICILSTHWTQFHLCIAAISIDLCTFGHLIDIYWYHQFSMKSRYFLITSI